MKLGVLQKGGGGLGGQDLPQDLCACTRVHLGLEAFTATEILNIDISPKQQFTQIPLKVIIDIFNIDF